MVFWKRNLLVAVVLLVLLGAGLLLLSLNKQSSPIMTASPTPTPQQSVSVSPAQSRITFPKGGETLVKGQTYTLTWTGGHDPVAIFLIDKSLEDQGASVSIADRKYGIKNTGSYEYAIPATLKDGQYKFQIDGMNSEYFTIVGK